MNLLYQGVPGAYSNLACLKAKEILNIEVNNINTYGKTASGVINFTSNVNDGDLLEVASRVFEFDDGLLSYNVGSIVVPIGATLEDTIINLLDEFDNYNVNYLRDSNSIEILAPVVGDSGNNVTLSGSSVSFSLDNNLEKLSGGVFYSSGYFDFSIDNTLELDQKYILSFYIASKSEISTTATNPALSITSGTGNIDNNVLVINDKWNKKEFIVNGNGANQKISFSIKHSQYLYFDKISLLPLYAETQFLTSDNISNFNISKLANFYYYDNNILLGDIINNNILNLSLSGGLDVISDFSLYDIKSLVLNLKWDYLSDTALKYFNYKDDSNTILYNIGNGEYNLQISNNIR